ncbi:MAG: hypothetical protein JSV12_02295 [Candidatus Bathyarchaeota archaeon]|nr:MAG: hypothetical protein JSV12_02295 [Candidatus Bathyarchaeota archaeon]
MEIIFFLIGLIVGSLTTFLCCYRRYLSQKSLAKVKIAKDAVRPFSRNLEQMVNDLTIALKVSADTRSDQHDFESFLDKAIEDLYQFKAVYDNFHEYRTEVKSTAKRLAASLDGLHGFSMKLHRATDRRQCLLTYLEEALRSARICSFQLEAFMGS